MSLPGRASDPDPRGSRSIILFIAFAMLLSIGYLVAQGGPASAGARRETSSVWSVLRGYGPALAAVLAAALSSGLGGLGALGGRLARWRIAWHLVALAFVLPIAVNALVLGIVWATGLAPLELAVPQGPRIIIAFLVFAIVDGPLGEEIGWRGYLLPLLLARTSALRASALIGVVWFAWHLPLYAADGRVLDAPFLVTYLASVMSISLIFTWFFVRSGGSVWLAVLLHTTTNYFQYATVTLFPGLRGTMADNRIFVLLLMCVAVATALDLRPADQGARASAFRPS